MIIEMILLIEMVSRIYLKLIMINIKTHISQTADSYL